MRRAPDQLVDVELVEDDHDGGSWDEPAPAGPPPWSSLVAAVPRRVWLGAAAAVTAVAVTAAAVEVADRVETMLRLADVPGLTVPLGDVLVPAWSADGDWVLGVVDGTAVVVGAGAEGGASGVDAVTGSVRYSVDGDSCQIAAPVLPGPWGAAAGVLQAGSGSLLVCAELASQHLVAWQETTTTLSVYDAATGELVRRVALGPVAMYEVAGTDVVSLGANAQGNAIVSRVALDTGQPVWTYRGGPVDPAATSLGLSQNKDVVWTYAGGQETVLDAVDGTVLDDAAWATQLESWGPVTLADGGSAMARSGAGGQAEVEVTNADGSHRFTQPKAMLLAPPGVDDGTAPSTMFTMTYDLEDFTSQGLLAATDTATGEVRWTGPEVGVASRVVLDDLLITEGASGLSAYDARTGEQRWGAGDEQARDPYMSGAGVVTDGRRTLTAVRRDGGAVLVAQDVATGATVWTAPSPVGSQVRLSQLPDGTVLAIGTSTVVALRAPAPAPLIPGVPAAP